MSAALDGFCIGERSRGLSQLPLGLVECCLKRTWVNLEEQLAFLDIRTFLIALPEQITCDLRPDVGIDQPVECADPLAKDLDILLHDLNRRHPRLRARYTFRAYCSNNQADDEPGKKPRRSRVCISKACSSSPSVPAKLRILRGGRQSIRSAVPAQCIDNRIAAVPDNAIAALPPAFMSRIMLLAR